MGALSADTGSHPRSWEMTRRPHADRLKQGSEDCLNSAFFRICFGGMGGSLSSYSPAEDAQEVPGLGGSSNAVLCMQVARHKGVRCGGQPLGLLLLVAPC